MEIPNDNSTQAGLENTNIEVRFASLGDIQKISLVQREHLLSAIDPTSTEELSRRGFLIHEISAEELKKLISDQENCLVLVAKTGDEIQGYAVAYDLSLLKNTNPQWEQTVRIPEDTKKILGNEEKKLYFSNMARKAQAKGIGSELTKALITEARRRKYRYIIVEILKKPIPNQASMKLHKRLGFEEIGETEENEDLIWSLLLKDLEEK